jgi:complex iron-sulfur molybdoenzyme family reductase subunit beta
MLWSDRDGADHMWFTMVETRPGTGYPKNWEEKSIKRQPMTAGDYEAVPTFDYQKLQNNPDKGMPRVLATMDSGPNWDEDIGQGKDVSDSWFYYLPVNCMHCQDPKCIPACPEKAIYKRADGAVLIDQTICQGAGDCVDACPYKRIYINKNTGKAEKCILCYPRVEKGMPPICVQNCPGKARFFGDLDDPQSPVYRLVKEFKVALPLHADFGTNPQIFYIPPVFGPEAIDSEGNSSGQRENERYLTRQFGPEIARVKKTMIAERAKRGSALMDVLCSYPTWKI